MSERPILETLSPDACLDLLATVSVGRVGVTIDALPAVLPVNFVLQDGTVVFRTVPGTKLDAATAGMVVAFEADQHGNANRPDGWSVLVRGVAREITEPGALERAPCAIAALMGVRRTSRPLHQDHSNDHHRPAYHH